MGPYRALPGKYRKNSTELSKLMNAHGQPMLQRLVSLNVDKEVITNRNPFGSHEVRQAVTEKTAEAPSRSPAARPPGRWP